MCDVSRVPIMMRFEVEMRRRGSDNRRVVFVRKPAASTRTRRYARSPVFFTIVLGSVLEHRRRACLWRASEVLKLSRKPIA